MTVLEDEVRVQWSEDGQQRSSYIRSENRFSPPRRIVVANDAMKADVAYRLACEGSAILWRGDFHNAKQLLQAMSRRANLLNRARKNKEELLLQPKDLFLRYRLNSAHLGRVLGLLFVEVEEDLSVSLRRAPETKEALQHVYEPLQARFLISLRELLGIIGAYQWRTKGVYVSALGSRIYPHFGVFAPVRQEYVDLVAGMEVQPLGLGIDVGTGTGVLAALLAKKGFGQVLAVDNEPRAIECARENIVRLGFDRSVQVVEADLFPKQLCGKKASLVVCNPPWMPLKAQSSLERAVYDPKSRMLYGFLRELPKYLDEEGEGWLLLSNLPELLGLRSRQDLLNAFCANGLKVKDAISAPANHRRSQDSSDLLYKYRKQEVTTLWRVYHKNQ